MVKSIGSDDSLGAMLDLDKIREDFPLSDAAEPTGMHSGWV